MSKINLRKFCVAPMMGCTTPHARKLYRMLTKKAFIFTEMIPMNTILYSQNKSLGMENENQNPLALQVGGSDYKGLSKCTKLAKKLNYDEINLNVGCPSKAVQKGSFGACLMNNKKLVRECLESMIDASDIEVSIKCRIGLGREMNYSFFQEFIEEIIKSGTKIVYVHARNALLSGLNPRKNRSIPPLNYNFLIKIKNDYPEIQFILNGGIDTIDKAYNLSEIHDGVMVGRLIQNNPFCLSKVDKIFFNEDLFRLEESCFENIILEYFKYVNKKLDNHSIFHLLSPILGIFFGIPKSKKFKSEIMTKMKNHEIENLKFLFLKFFNANYTNLKKM